VRCDYIAHVVNGQWALDKGQWAMGNGQWATKILASDFALRPSPFAHCPLPFALCPLPLPIAMRGRQTSTACMTASAVGTASSAVEI
jgi:hypothetical protein